MIGSNTLILNTSTMKEIVQEYLDRRYRVNSASTLVVHDVRPAKQGMATTFEVEVHSKKVDECPNATS